MSKKETQKILQEGEELYQLVRGEGWAAAKRKLVDRLRDAGSIFSITETDPQAAFQKLAAQQIAVELVMGWLEDVEGSAADWKNNQEQYNDLLRDDPIVEFE